MTGSTILHYEIGERLGAGGMGEVYRARDTRLGRQVAIKFISAQFREDPERRARLLKEARAASMLRSPSIATTYDIGEHDGALFVVMELVEGELLSDRLRRGSLPVTQAVDIATQIADALDEAHGLHMVHRDIKSANLILTERGLVKILDFGLAKFTAPLGDEAAGAPTVAQTRLGMVVGTVSYMSPEQALGRPVDSRSDLFSLGVVVYEMLTAHLPFEGETLTAVIDEILHREPPALARFNYDVPPQLDGIVRKTLAKDPGFRYQSPQDLLIDLRTLRRELDTGSRAPAPGKRTTSTRVAAPNVETPAPRNAVAVIPFSNITREPADNWIGSGIAETVTGDLKSIRGLSVIGRERIFEALRNLGSGDIADPDERFTIEIGRQLRARWLVSGGYQRIGDVIRITARFVDVNTGTVIRTVKIDGAINEIFTLQDKIVYELSQGLNLKLGDSEVAEIERNETASVEAYENRSRAMMNLLEASPQALDRAIYLLEKATQSDPNYASAWAALGAAYDLKGSFLSLPDLAHKAIEFERRALQLNPRLADAHRWLGSALLSIGRYEESIEAIKESIRLQPDDAGAHSALGRAYWIGKGMLDEGIAELERAIAINPDLGYAHLQLGLLYVLRGNYARAERACRHAIDLQERITSGKEGLQVVGAYTRLGYVYYVQGRYDEAIEVYERQLQSLGATDHALRERSLIELNQKLGAAHQRKGEPDEAEHYFKQAVKGFESRLARGADDPFTKYYIACLYALRGDVDRAVRYLEESLGALRAVNSVRAQADPDFAGIRHDPRFLEVVASPVR